MGVSTGVAHRGGGDYAFGAGARLGRRSGGRRSGAGARRRKPVDTVRAEVLATLEGGGAHELSAESAARVGGKLQEVAITSTVVARGRKVGADRTGLGGLGAARRGCPMESTPGSGSPVATVAGAVASRRWRRRRSGLR
ncbi:uncharacterized protein M6B38_271065 [Iris pallida]|uniref:Uncharacterized protein n=1 Tax=Iris pallida TaxID=29817 RepID=A0AAX6I7Y5_IRIPA|nr:uncharacterized protein M6B38_134945 [Iris pallida]KAJ6815112.1 uncharacterized protein M6B38_134950 [Iris pallida]KAJ6815113.1 uncharacterized protein M6B38_134955 [Iris pallida]KAJ6849110.1 uncharacterized protein M6B38_271060 [Iris pallida]KAJ6849111.1 uncharacterized protein M6B38_271065 [Iris pallida]